MRARSSLWLLLALVACGRATPTEPQSNSAHASSAERNVARPAATDEISPLRVPSAPFELGPARELPTEVGHRARYASALASARNGDVDTTLYWLQRAALEEGVEPDRVATDDNLAALHADPRWPAVVAFLDRTAAYWATHGTHRIVVITPPGRRPGRGWPVLVGLHQDGSAPEQFLVDEAYRARAKRTRVAFVGVSGTVPLGPTTYRWSRDPDQNARRIEEALDELRARTPIEDRRIALFGLSEGAQVALETAARAPDRYRGAIAVSPTRLGWHLDELEPSEHHARQHYVVAFGSFETFETVGTSYVDVSLLRALGADVDVHTAWFVTRHALAPDFDVQLPRWINYIFDRAAP